MARINRRIAFYERQTAVANSVAAVGRRATAVIGPVAVVLDAVHLVVEPSLTSAAWLAFSVAVTAYAVWSVVGEKRKKREQKSSPAA